MNKFVNFTNNLPRDVTGGAVTVAATCSVCEVYRAWWTRKCMYGRARMGGTYFGAFAK